MSDEDQNLFVKIFEEDIKNIFSRDCWNSNTGADDLRKIFKSSCFYFTENETTNAIINENITEFSKVFIAGLDSDFNHFKSRVISYNSSALCGVVWLKNELAYRCGTCSSEPAMSLCVTCFKNGNHVGHDYNTYKSYSGGTCDCGNPHALDESGFCCNHGRNRLDAQNDPPDSSIGRFKVLISLYLRCFLFALWSVPSTSYTDKPPTDDLFLSIMTFLDELISCGSVTQKIIAEIMIDRTEFNDFINEFRNMDQYQFYENEKLANPDFIFPDKVGSQQLIHETILDAFMLVCIKLRFPENLVKFLLGLLPIDLYQEVFVHSYLNHYSRIAFGLLIQSQVEENNIFILENMILRISAISVQFFLFDVVALKLVKERNVHYLIVHCLFNMLKTTLTSLDSNGNSVLDCRSKIIQKDAYSTLIRDLMSLFIHKSVVDLFFTDSEFMKDYIKFLRWMQFMDIFILREGNHVEYNTIECRDGSMIEYLFSVSWMWKIWYHYHSENNKETVKLIAQYFLTSLAEYIDNLEVFKADVVQDQSRKPLSFHLPLMRSVACFLSLALTYHHLPLALFLQNISMKQMIRWFTESSNVLLGYQEVNIGYWVRNGSVMSDSIYFYTHPSYSYGMIEMDILSSQICSAVIPCSTVIYTLTDSTQLLKGIEFKFEFNSDVDSAHDTCNILNKDIDRRALALEAWLTNLCFLTDLRNEMIVDDEAKLRKEVCSILCSEPLKRSHLNDRLPDRTGIKVHETTKIDSILNEVANFTQPTFNEYSADLQSGFYSLKPELWDTDYDPIFMRLRNVSKQDAVKALSNYREYYRKKENLSRPNSLWPPYRIPPPPHSEISQLDNILHCKDLTYIIFCSLHMFMKDDPIVTEDSLALIVHLLHRSLLIDKPLHNQKVNNDFDQTRFPNNPYKVDNIWTNISIPITVKRESILSLLLKIHSKLHTLRLLSGGKSLLSSKSSKLLNINDITKTPLKEVTVTNYEAGDKSKTGSRFSDVNTVKFFIKHPLVYEYSRDNLLKAKQNGLGINWGDGVDFVGHLFDIIASKNDDHSKCLFKVIDDLNHFNVGQLNTVYESDSQGHQAHLESVATIDSIEENKKKANANRQRIISDMALKQKTFATAHQLDVLDTIITNDNKKIYECVICQQSNEHLDDTLVLLGTLCSADLLKYMEDGPRSNGCDMIVTCRKDYVDNVSVHIPILSHGIIIQTCGHVVHRNCFRSYMDHTPSTERIICPLCRRDVHHLTPIQIQEITNPSPNSLYSSLKTQLLQSLNTQLHDLKTDIIDDHIAKNEMANISIAHQACSLLRSQLELELIVCLSVPDQYSTITKRCHWSQFISYLRTLNVDSITLINQSDSLLGTSFSHDLNRDDKDDKSKHLPFLFEVPSDLFLNFIPYIWPHEDHILHILKACIVMAYVKGMVMIGGRLTQSEYDYWCRDSAEDDDDFQKQFSLVLKRCRQVYYQESFNGFAKDTVVKETIVTDLMKCLMPLLRIASVLKLHLLKVDDVPSNFPIVTIDNAKNIEFCGEFHRLCEFLNLPLRNNSSNKDSSEQLVSMVSACVRSTMYNDFNEVVDEFIDRDLKGHKTIRLYNTTLDPLNVGNELYPPHLIELPNSYDELFNTYHSQRCNPSSKDCIHNYPENGLCLICGNLVCFICKRIPQAFGEHTNECCFGVGVIIEVNTSIIYVLVNNEASEWGSVYLDNYGEEDLELKRGRPLFINDRRLNLLKQQWLTHSFRHVLKTWRKIS